MNFAEKYITNINTDDVKYACAYKVHSSYVFVGIIVTWFLSFVSTILTTLFLSSVFITIVNVARSNRDENGDARNNLLSKLNESSSEYDSSDEEATVEKDPVNSKCDSLLNHTSEIVIEQDDLENKKVN